MTEQQALERLNNIISDMDNEIKKYQDAIYFLDKKDKYNINGDMIDFYKGKIRSNQRIIRDINESMKHLEA